VRTITKGATAALEIAFIAAAENLARQRLECVGTSADAGERKRRLPPARGKPDAVL
jgi:hypothetical protein